MTDSHVTDYNPDSVGDPPVIENIRASVADAFDQVDELIVKQLRSDVDLVENVGHYIVAAGGKRLRPLLALLAARVLGDVSSDHVKFSAIIEFIHTATLLHDDVVDISSLRRGRATANETFGNAPSVLVGDFMYTRAFQLMVELGDLRLLEHMANTTNIIAEGEVLQLVRAGNASVNEAQYQEVIERKTAILFASACRGAAMLSDAPQHEQSLHDYGLHLGIAFQMIDDVLDYTGDPEEMGKNVGDDLSEGKPTLPLIHVMNTGSAEDRDIVRTAIETKSKDSLNDVVAAVTRCGGAEYTLARAIYHRDKAISALAEFDDSPEKSSLLQLATLSVERSH